MFNKKALSSEKAAVIGATDTIICSITRKNRHLRFPHSLRLLYSAFTYYCGFKVNSGAYKLIWVSALW
jgi:predicted NodU family carbamoyl transferase